MKKYAVCLLLNLCLIIVLSGAEPDLTEGMWNVSVPEKSGEIKPFGTSFRFKTDGTAELVYSEKVLKLKEQMRQKYKKRTGKEIKEPESGSAGNGRMICSNSMRKIPSSNSSGRKFM